MRILAIETSCDETAISIVEFQGSKKKPLIKILSNIVSSQVKLHAKFGGVVPNIAKREHQKNLVPIILHALREADLLKSKIKNKKLKLQFKIQNQIKIILEREPELLKLFLKKIVHLKAPLIDAIAVTYGPGLAPALWVGVNFARALAYLWQKPLIPVNHMEGHLYSALLQSAQKNSKHEVRNSKQTQNSKFKIPGFGFRICETRELPAKRKFPSADFGFPAMALLVSGGHTELVLMRGYGKYKIIGETLDDAAGEAFDKVARMLGLGYPGGPAISAAAEMEFKSLKFKVTLPRPMINSKDYNFSFSGLKTAVLYLIRELTKKHPIKKIRPLVAKEFQNAVVDVLVKKTINAAKEYKAKTILLGGGVAANKLLRGVLIKEVKKELPLVACRLSLVANTGDNALMIALAAYFSGKKKAPTAVGAEPNLRF